MHAKSNDQKIVPDGTSVRVPLMLCDSIQRDIALTSPGVVVDGVTDRREQLCRDEAKRQADLREPHLRGGISDPARVRAEHEAARVARERARQEMIARLGAAHRRGRSGRSG